MIFDLSLRPCRLMLFSGPVSSTNHRFLTEVVEKNLFFKIFLLKRISKNFANAIKIHNLID